MFASYKLYYKKWNSYIEKEKMLKNYLLYGESKSLKWSIMHCCSYPLSTFLPNGSEDLPFIYCGLERTRTFNLWIKDYISDSNRNYNFHYITNDHYV